MTMDIRPTQPPIALIPNPAPLPDYRALLAELYAAVDATCREQGVIFGPRLTRARAATRAALEAAPC